MIFCKWMGLTAKSSYVVTIEGEMKSPTKNIKQTVKCCEITLSSNGLIIGKKYIVKVGPSMSTVSLKGMSSFKRLNLIDCSNVG